MKNNRQTQATVITPKELDKVKMPLPKSWKKAAGLLAHKRGLLKKYIQTIRKEWD